MSTTPDTAPRLALLALDLTGGDAEAVEALLTRLAQVTRYAVEPGGVAVGAVRHLIVPGLTAGDFFAAMASLGTRDE
jgi:hypothetical protein